MHIRFSKIEAGNYVARDDDGNVVGYVSKTGTHLDNYPWDWSLVGDRLHGQANTGVADTLRSAKAQVRYAITGSDGLSD